jgi:hypothetical protein
MVKPTREKLAGPPGRNPYDAATPLLVRRSIRPATRGPASQRTGASAPVVEQVLSHYQAHDISFREIMSGEWIIPTKSRDMPPRGLKAAHSIENLSQKITGGSRHRPGLDALPRF